MVRQIDVRFVLVMSLVKVQDCGIQVSMLRSRLKIDSEVKEDGLKAIMSMT